MAKEERGFYWALLVIAYPVSLLSVFGVYDWVNDIVTGEQIRKQVDLFLLLSVPIAYALSLSLSTLCFVRGTATIRVASAICLILSALSIAGLVGLFAFDRAYLDFGPD
ncbi:hypothetical protein C3941_03570 [Kaistia algarum]|nr:hypothetical protein C3941_03570 [Kaistia algarum]